MILGGLEIVLVGATASVAKAIWEEVCRRVAEHGVDWGESLLDGLLSRDAEAIAEVENTLVRQGDVAEEVRAVVAERSGKKLLLHTLSDVDHTQRDTDFIVSAYQATFYDLAVVTSLAGLPVVVEGSLQGSDWLLVCERSNRFSGLNEPLLPDPESVWRRYESSVPPQPMLSLSEALSHSFEFYARHVADMETRTRLRDQATRLARTTGSIVSGDHPPSETPFDDRWIKVRGVAPYFVCLEPYGEAILNFDMQALSHGIHMFQFVQYPEPWQELIEIPDPGAAVKRVRTAVWDIAKSNGALRTNLDAMFN